MGYRSAVPSVRERTKQLLRSLRYSQPFNWIATGVVRALVPSAKPGGVIHRHLHKVGTTTVFLPQGQPLRMRANADDGVSNDLFWGGWDGYEPEVTPDFYERARSARVTLDVGAHVGFYAVLAGIANPAGKVYAFEPLPPIFARLQSNVLLNELANVECIQTVVSDRRGEIDFYYSTETELPSSSSTSLEFMKDGSKLTNRRLATIPIDEVVAERGIVGVDLVKIDTETTEPQVLAGMAALLERDRPAIICEVLAGFDVETRLDALVAQHRYVRFLMTDTGLVPRDCIIADKTWKNWLFLAKERA